MYFSLTSFINSAISVYTRKQREAHPPCRLELEGCRTTLNRSTRSTVRYVSAIVSAMSPPMRRKRSASPLLFGVGSSSTHGVPFCDPEDASAGSCGDPCAFIASSRVWSNSQGEVPLPAASWFLCVLPALDAMRCAGRILDALTLWPDEGGAQIRQNARKAIPWPQV